MSITEFLEWYRPGGPWLLTAINPAGGCPTTSESYDSSSIEQLQQWVEYQNGRGWNIYFGVNPTRRKMQKKAGRSDIASLDWLHVDVDPDKTKDFQEERQRLLDLVKSEMREVPKPSLIIDSGGGYQLFWRLEKPMPIGGREEAYSAAAAYNKHLEALYGADHCHNADRIMRLPGTINHPNAKKTLRGQKPAQAQVIYYSEASYPLDGFQSAPLVQEGSTLLDTVPVEDVDVDVLAPAVGVDLDTLPAEVSPTVKAVIVTGEDPTDECRWEGDRSDALLYVCCQLIRAKVDDSTIFSILMDEDLGISASVRDKGSDMACRRYALRQISRAKEFVHDPNLMELNNKYACIMNMAGKFRIATEVIVPGPNQDRTALTYMAPADFKSAYANRFVEIPDKDNGTKYVPMADWWLKHPKRRQYETLAFAPEREIPGVFNLWRGFSVSPRAGDCSLYLNHVKNIVCGGNEKYYDYLIKWLANCVQYPGTPGQVAVVLRGCKGAGKGITIDHFGKLFGRHFIQVANSKHVVGNFNAHLQDCVLLFGDEAFYAGDKTHESVLKALITEDMLGIEQKGINLQFQQSCLHIMMSSNEKWVVPSSGDERRFFVLDVSSERAQDIPYFEAIAQQMENGGYEALLHYLLTLDLEGFQVRVAPKTEALYQQQMLSLPYREEWFFRVLERGYWSDNHDGWENRVSIDLLVNDYAESAPMGRTSKARVKKDIEDMIRMISPTVGMARHKKPVILDNGKTICKPLYFVNIVPLEEARENWCRETGLKVDWPEPIPLIDDMVF